MTKTLHLNNGYFAHVTELETKKLEVLLTGCADGSNPYSFYFFDTYEEILEALEFIGGVKFV